MNKLHVLHLSTYDYFGGAGRGAYRIHQSLLHAGCRSEMCVRYSSLSDESICQLPVDNSFSQKLSRVLRRARIEVNRKYYRVQPAQCAIRGRLTDPRGDLLTNWKQLLVKPDIVHIHKCEGFVDMPNFLRSIPQEIPVVIQLHDLSPLTGGCDYPSDCKKFEHTCGMCPILYKSHNNDYSTKIYKLKKLGYESRNIQKLAFVANSRWTAKEAMRSSLAQNKHVPVIHIPIELEIYHSQNRKISRRLLGINDNDFVILFSAHDLNNQRKGGKILVDALLALSRIENIRLLSFGSGMLKLPSELTNLYHHFFRVDDPILQSVLYQASDVFIVPSLEEAYGMTAAEAVACGTVTIVFESGGLTDIVEDKVNGRVVTEKTSHGLMTIIREVMKDVDFRKKWENTSRNLSKEKFSKDNTGTKYINLYKNLLDN